MQRESVIHISGLQVRILIKGKKNPLYTKYRYFKVFSSIMKVILHHCQLIQLFV